MARIYFYRRCFERYSYISKFPCVFLVCVILLFIHHQSSTVVWITLKSVLYRRRKIFIQASGWMEFGVGEGDFGSKSRRCAGNRRDHEPVPAQQRFHSSIYFTSLITRNAKFLTRSVTTKTTTTVW